MQGENITKPVIVPFFNQVNHLMKDDVINAMFWFFDHLKIYQYSPGLRVTTPPSGLHLPDDKGIDRYPKNSLPFFNTGRYYFF
jgi:hypothetical protein